VGQESLVGISEASHILGVSEAALRQWTNDGKIKAFVTPGGHRRYSKEELKKLLTLRQKKLGIKDLAAEIENTVPIHRELSRTYLNSTSRHDGLDKDARERLGELSQRLLKLIIRYIAEPLKREETINLARDIGRSFGQLLAQLGLPLNDSVEAFIVHRVPLMNAATSMIRKREAYSGRLVEAISKVDYIMDEVLVALVSAHEQYQEMLPSKSRGGAA